MLSSQRAMRHVERQHRTYESNSVDREGRINSPLDRSRSMLPLVVHLESNRACYHTQSMMTPLGMVVEIERI